ncbi:MAG: methyltransferase domain-containing protein [Nitrospinota bacterium]|nr:MAG: methyltransferase domain-containing protein [Nitrospinota bacterium]
MTAEKEEEQSAGSRWDPHQYLKFSDYRQRPALELLARVPLIRPQVIYDLGCGSGHVTRIIAERWPSAVVYGVDNSPDMLARARTQPGGIHWLEADIRYWQPDHPPDLLYANATLHWIEKHEELFPRLLGFLRPGGCLAVQMPLSWDAPSHRLMRETLARGGPGGRPLGTEELRRSVGRKWVAEAETYYDLLVRYTRSLDIWETEYIQILEGENPVLEWVKGTALRPILTQLDDREREIFLQEYGQRLRTAYPPRPDGRTLYPFRRLFIVATV